MGKNSTHPWSITKSGPQPLLHRDRTEYEHHSRAQQVYSQWMSGTPESDIAGFFGITEIDVLRDIQHIQQVLPVRTVISHLHDRNRVLILKAEGKQYQELLHQSLNTPAAEFIKNGVSPTSVMKEYREATGMVEKPGSMISITKNTANFGGGPPGEIPLANFGGNGRPRSFEELLRMIIAADPICGLQPVIEVEAQESVAPADSQIAEEDEKVQGEDDFQEG
jgi:hypothetical protein